MAKKKAGLLEAFRGSGLKRYSVEVNAPGPKYQPERWSGTLKGQHRSGAKFRETIQGLREYQGLTVSRPKYLGEFADWDMEDLADCE